MERQTPTHVVSDHDLHYLRRSMSIAFYFFLVRTESECCNHIYHFHKGSLAYSVGHFTLNTV